MAAWEFVSRLWEGDRLSLQDSAIAANRLGLGARPGGLKPATDLRSLFKAALRDHMGVEEARLEREVFPDSSSAKPMDGLFRRT